MPTEPGRGVVVVTGSSAGIGRAIAQWLLAEGWAVHGLDLAPAAWTHDQFTAQAVDLATAEGVAAAVREAPAPVALVHAAGVLRVGALGALDAAAGQTMWQVHVAAVERLANAWLPGMAERGHGRVVLVGSRVSQGMPGRSQYAATKAALVALARSWAAELAARGVTVNVVSPAATRTGMLADPARAASPPRLPPLGRLIEPAEIASLVAYLLSPAAACLTGQDIALCGGSSLSS